MLTFGKLKLVFIALGFRGLDQTFHVELGGLSKWRLVERAVPRVSMIYMLETYDIWDGCVDHESELFSYSINSEYE
jgi:hypothetical protein